MSRNILSHYPDVLSEFFVASAVVSAIPEFKGGKRKLHGKLLFDSAGKKLPVDGRPSVVEISKVPEKWPRSWSEGDFQFYDFYPEVPQRRDCPPDQINLNRIFEYLMRENLLE